MVMRQQPMALHARRSLIRRPPQDGRQLSALPRASPLLSQEILQGRIVQHGVGQEPLQPGVLILRVSRKPRWLETRNGPLSYFVLTAPKLGCQAAAAPF
jgi:hypothetical protein